MRTLLSTTRTAVKVTYDGRIHHKGKRILTNHHRRNAPKTPHRQQKTGNHASGASQHTFPQTHFVAPRGSFFGVDAVVGRVDRTRGSLSRQETAIVKRRFKKGTGHVVQ